MPIGHHKENGVLIMQPTGRINSSDAPAFRHEIDAAIDANDMAVVMDMEALDYISSGGLRVLLEFAQALGERDARFALCSLSSSVQDVFRISGFDRMLTIRDARDEALIAVTR